MKPTLGQLAALLNTNERLIGLLGKPTQSSLKAQLQSIMDSEEKLELLRNLVEKAQRNVISLRGMPISLDVKDPPNTDGSR